MLGAEEVPWQGKQIWCSFGLVDVNDVFALWVDVEARREAFRTVCVCAFCRVHVRGKKRCKA